MNEIAAASKLKDDDEMFVRLRALFPPGDVPTGDLYHEGMQLPDTGVPISVKRILQMTAALYHEKHWDKAPRGQMVARMDQSLTGLATALETPTEKIHQQVLALGLLTLNILDGVSHGVIYSEWGVTNGKHERVCDAVGKFTSALVSVLGGAYADLWPEDTNAFALWGYLSWCHLNAISPVGGRWVQGLAASIANQIPEPMLGKTPRGKTEKKGKKEKK